MTGTSPIEPVRIEPQKENQTSMLIQQLGHELIKGEMQLNNYLSQSMLLTVLYSTKCHLLEKSDLSFQNQPTTKVTSA